MRPRFLLITLFIVVALLGVSGRKLMHAQLPTAPTTTNIPQSQSYLVILGIGDQAATTWDGSITVTGANLQVLRGWRFTPDDSITTASWKLSTRTSPALNGPGPVQENGVIVKISAPASSATLNVTTAQGNFSFSTQDLPFGVSKTFLSGKALVAQTNAQFQLTTSSEEEDFPVMAQSGDDVYLIYTEFVHGDRSVATGQGTKQPITDFSFLARPAGGDQLLLQHYSKSQRTWTGPYPVTGTGEDLMRSAVAVDGQGRAWFFYSAQRSGNFDIYARTAKADGSVSSEMRLTTDAGTDVFPVATTDASGRVWVAWQGFRDGHLVALTSAQTGDTFSPESIVSVSPSSNWDPAIAAGSDGQVAISWDTYDKGDYDVYLRRVFFTDQVGLDDPIPIAVTLDFEARSSLAFDLQNRLWIAYEVAGTRWGKDFGAYDTTGLPLYASHTIQVRCLIGNDLYQTSDDIANTLPGAPANQLFRPSTHEPFPEQPDPTLAQNRALSQNIVPPAGPRNSFPRLATDPDGTVYLAFREFAGSGLSSSNATGGVSVGSIWVGAIVYFDGSAWHGPGVLGFTDAVGDNRPSILALGPGRLLIAHSSDHRLAPLRDGTPQLDGVSSDVFQSDLAIARTQNPPQLQKIGRVTPATPEASVAAEDDAAILAQSYRPTINGQRLQLIRGDFHRHTEISWDGRNDGPLIDAYRYYIDSAALGWAGCCDHDNGDAREYTWWLIQKFSDAYLLGSRFIPMFYYERSVNYPEGHRNVVFAQRGVRTLPRLPTSAEMPRMPAPDTNMLYSYLHFFGGMSAPHTSATDQGTDWRNNDPDVESFVEIYQGDRQDYERADSPRANTATDSISGYRTEGYVSAALLANGYKLAFEASSDHISTHISYTNIWATTPTRAAILDAMHRRRMYGSTDNIIADFRSGSHFMGEAFTTSSQPVFTVRLWGTAAFQTVVVVKDDVIVYSTSGGRVLSFSWQDNTAQKGKTSYYYVRGLQTDGQVVWVSPMWVTMQ